MSGSALFTWVAGNKPTAAQLTDMEGLAARKPVDETVNNSATLQNDDDLSFAVDANATYDLLMHLQYSSGTTPDLKVGFTFPTGLTMKWGGAGYDTTGALVFFGNLTQTTVAGFGGTGGDVFAIVSGIVSVGANSGTWQLQWAQNTANASNTIMRAGSRAWLRKVN